MNAHIEHDPLSGMVKVWLYNRGMNNETIYMFPTEISATGVMTIMQVLVPEGQKSDEVRPFLEMTRPIWDAFIKAVRSTDMEIPVGKLLYKVLEREQDRVDALITSLIKQHEPQLYLTSPPQEGP